MNVIQRLQSTQTDENATMRTGSNKFVFVAFAFLIFQMNLEGAAGQTSADDEWQEIARERLSAIYEEGNFRAEPDRREWLTDSSAFVVRERDPQTGRQGFAQYDVQTGERTNGRRPAESDSLISPDGSHRLVRRGLAVFAINVANEQRTKLVESDPERDIYFGKLRWSPSGNFVSFLEYDRTDVPFRTMLVPEDPSYPGTTERRFARVGETIETLRVGIVDASGESIHWVPLEAPEEGRYIRTIQWVPGEDRLLIETLSRFRDKREFWLTSPDGNLKRLFSEINDAWAVGSHEINSGAEWLQDGSAFVFISEKDGWRRAYKLSIEDGEVTPLMSGEYELIDRAFMDEESGGYYFYASPDNGTQRYLYRVPLDGSAELERISPGDQPGTHNYNVSPDRKWAIHSYSTANDPPQVDLVELPSHRRVRILEDNADLRELASRVNRHAIEFVKVDIGDDVVMDASLTRPGDFDESKKYPVFVYVYGEPYAQTVLDEWGTRHADSIDWLPILDTS
ncbi:MAG: DPP IV N-terminal domain-containing protein [Planctomycetota bacterium]